MRTDIRRPGRRPLATLAATAAAVAAASTLALGACADELPTGRAGGLAPNAAGDAPGTHRQYGTPVQVSGGRARSYVVLDEQSDAPLELGVALDEAAMDGLRGPDLARDEHHDHDMFDLPVPARNATPVQFVELDWNPRGHGFPHDSAHFDFHFYTITKAQRDAIDPQTNPNYAAEGDLLPPPAFVPEFNILPVPPGTPPSATAVPHMGVHLVDVRSPEIQGLLGNPNGYRPFTTTFIHGSWNGKIIFFEPMITRRYIAAKKTESDAAKRDEVIALPQAQRYSPAGYYPKAYRIQWDAQAREFRIALTQLTMR